MFRHLLNAFSPQKKVGEESLEFSELRYRRLFETAQDGILILDAQSGKIDDVNPFLQELIGYSHDQLVGKELWQIGVFKDIADSKKAFLELQTKGYIRYKDLPLQTKDGRKVDVEFISNTYLVDHHKVIQCNIRDITCRKKTEEIIKARTRELENLTKSQEETKNAMMNVMEDLEEAKNTIEIEKVKDEAMLASIGEGLIAVDNNKKITIINEAAENMLGWKKEELRGKEITVLPLIDEDGKAISLDRRPTQVALSTGKTIANNYFFERKDKTRFPIAIVVTPIVQNSKIIGAIVIFRDATREKEIDRAKSEFVSLASHQLRTPLSAIKWYSKMLIDEDVGKINEKQKEYLNEIHRGNERMVALVNALLNVSRIELGTFAVQPKKLSIIKICKEVLEEVKEDVASKNLSIKENFDDVSEIEADPNYIRIIFENLITNSVKYTPPNGKITVSISENQTDILFSVKDTGFGIPASSKNKIFTKLYRADNIACRDTDGTGLGLYITKSIVEQAANGKIWFSSEENKGSTFFVSLPKVGMKKREGVKGLV